MRAFRERETISAPTSDVAPASVRRDAVVALRLLRTGAELELPALERFAIGASDGCEIAIPDDFASHVHCTLERRDGRLFVRDHRSKNGTYLNGNRVELATLTPGNLLTVGKTVFVALGERGRGRLSAFEALRGADPAFRAAVARAIRAASSAASVLVVGETGTGKELVARAVHDASPRAGGPFVAVNCGAIPEDLIEAELFGHERGAFTGADRERDGVFVQADGGTLFLDELGELPRPQQTRLLRVLETRRVRRIGGAAERPVDLRLVSATNRLDLTSDDAPLRLDVYHRVATIVVHLPPLRERADDIPELVAGFLAELAAELGPRTIAADALAALARYPWPGNVRELRQAIYRAAALSTGALALDDLLPPLGEPTARMPLGPRARTTLDARPTHPPPVRPSAAADPIAGDGAWEFGQRRVLRDALAEHGSIREAARALGMPKSTFADRARRLGLTPRDG